MNQAATIDIAQNDDGCVLEIEHVFRAPIDDVYAAWSDPKRLAKWWGPQGMTCPVCDWTLLWAERTGLACSLQRASNIVSAENSPMSLHRRVWLLHGCGRGMGQMVVPTPM